MDAEARRAEEVEDWFVLIDSAGQDFLDWKGQGRAIAEAIRARVAEIVTDAVAQATEKAVRLAEQNLVEREGYRMKAERLQAALEKWHKEQQAEIAQAVRAEQLRIADMIDVGYGESHEIAEALRREPPA